MNGFEIDKQALEQTGGRLSEILKNFSKLKEQKERTFLEDDEYEYIKKEKLTHKDFDNILELEDFVNKRKITSSRIVNVQFIQTGFSGYYELIYFK